MDRRGFFSRFRPDKKREEEKSGNSSNEEKKMSRRDAVKAGAVAAAAIAGSHVFVREMGAGLAETNPEHEILGEIEHAEFVANFVADWEAEKESQDRLYQAMLDIIQETEKVDETDLGFVKSRILAKADTVVQTYQEALDTGNVEAARIIQKMLSRVDLGHMVE